MPTANLRRLEMLRDMLIRHDELFPTVTFNMNVWYREDPSCGTAACAFGSACLYEPFQEEGLHLAQFDWQEGVYDPAYEGSVCYSAATLFFDLSFQEAQYLFDPQEYPGLDPAHITPQMVAERVQELIDSYTPGGAYDPK